MKGLSRGQARVREWQASGLQGRYSPKEDAGPTATLIKRGAGTRVADGFSGSGSRSRTAERGPAAPGRPELVPRLLLQQVPTQ